VPLYEAKMIYHFTHRFGDFALLAEGEREHILPQVPDSSLAKADYMTMPRYWVAKKEVDSRLGEWNRGWLLGWRDVTDARSSVRTVVVSVIPRVAVGHTTPLMFPGAKATVVAALYANLCDALADAIRTGKTYTTRLDPPPADPRIAHRSRYPHRSAPLTGT
jgi:hypothetical protein